MTWPLLPGTEELLYLCLRVLMLITLYGFLFVVLRVMMREIRLLALANGKAPGLSLQVELQDAARSGLPPGLRWSLERMTTIGREADNDIQIDDPFLSGHHAEITREAGNWWVSDRSSTNGTRLNGSPVTALTALRPGDIVQFGQVTLRVVDPGDG